MANGGDGSTRAEDVETTIVIVALAAAFSISTADIFLDFMDDQQWVFPLIFVTLILILRWVDITRRRVSSIAAGAPLRTYDTASDFYAEALRAIERGTKTAYAVFSHNTAPPQQTLQSRRYYARTIEWARESPGRRLLHRVIRLPAHSPDIQQWVDEQVNLSQEIENYHVKILRYPPGMAIEGENFVVIDSSVIFLGFAVDERGELNGFSIRDPRVAKAFEEHFKELWRIASAPTNRPAHPSGGGASLPDPRPTTENPT